MALLTGHTITSDSALGGLEIERSLKFNSSESAHLDRTPSARGNRKVWTYSCWYKLTQYNSGNKMMFLSSGASGNTSSMHLTIRNGSDSHGVGFTGVGQGHLVTIGSKNTFEKHFREFGGGWYNFVWHCDTTGSSGDYLKTYSNGTLVTSGNLDWGAAANTFINNHNYKHTIGDMSYTGVGELDGYLAEINFVDGRALDASYFGYTDEQTGLWRPKKFDNSGPNNGTTWSSNATASNFASGDAANVFNGTCANTTINSTDASNNHFTLSSVNVKASSVGVRVSNSGSDITVYINGSSVGTVASGDMSSNVPKLFTFTFTETTVSTVKVQRGSSTSGWYIWEMQLNGVPLVDGDKSNVGINGFRLDFLDNSSTTTLGKDRSGNGNDWTPSNISVSSGVGNDSVIDTPTNSFATIQADMRGPRDDFDDTSGTLSEGGLKLVLNGSGDDFGATMSVSEGRWYHEVKLVNSQNHGAGWADLNDFYNDAYTASTSGIVNSDAHYGTAEESTGSVIVNNGSTSASPSQFADNDILGFALDLDSAIRTLGIYRNGSLISTITGIAEGTYIPILGDDSSADASFEINFGQQPFVHTQPTGYLTLCSKNIRPHKVVIVGEASSYILRPKRHFETLLYTGDNTTSRKISGLEFKPDLVWIKPRNATSNHVLLDSVRGVHQRLLPNSTGANVDNSATITAFNDDGFQIGNSSLLNTDTRTHVAWCWKAGGAATTYNGNITSSVSVNKEAGFSIASYTGNGTSGASFLHALGKKPDLFIIKRTDGTGNWIVYDSVNGATNYMILSSTAATSTNSALFNDTEPDFAKITLGNDADTNGNTNSYICYAWTSIPGYSKIGTYTGSGNAADGPFVHTGFRVGWLMTKRSSSTRNWIIYDNKRGPYNEVDNFLEADTSNAEDSKDMIDFTSTGFRLRDSDTDVNSAGDTYIYMVFAEQPGTTPFGTFPNAR